MKFPSKIQFADENIQKNFEKLKTSRDHERKKIFEWLMRAFEDIEENAFCGIQIPKKCIPREYILKQKITNLWKYNLPNSWRLLYSIQHGEVIVLAIILEWLDHKNYERRFNY